MNPGTDPTAADVDGAAVGMVLSLVAQRSTSPARPLTTWGRAMLETTVA